MTNNDELALKLEQIEWLHGAAEEAAAVNLKMTMKPEEILQITSMLLALLAEREADKKRIAEQQEHINSLNEGMNMLLAQYDQLAAAIGWTTEKALSGEGNQEQYAEAMVKRIAELEARTVSVKLPGGWHFEECETEGCQNGAIFSVGKATNNIHLCEACTKEPVYARFTKTALPKRLPFSIAAGIKPEVGE